MQTRLGLNNSAKERMAAGQAALGFTARLSRSADIARIAKATGHDFLFIDGQHSIFDLETIAHMANAALAIGIAPLVRVRGVDDPDVPVLLDNCVAGIIYPDVNTVAEARRAVERAKFPPIGKRSVVGAYPQFDYRSVPLKEGIPQLNDSCLVVCMIEAPEGLKNVEAIAEVEGIDVLHLGGNDYLAAIGKPGQFDDPALAAAQERVLKAARQGGKFAGCAGIRGIDQQIQVIRQGFQFLTTQTDIAFISSAATQWVQAIRKATPEK